MELIFKPLEQKEAIVVLGWQYPSPYDRYNFVRGNFSEDDLKKALIDLTNPENAFFSIFGKRNTLEGVCSFGPDGQVPGGDYSKKALDIGMGLRPDLTGKGLGQQYAAAVVKFGISRYRPQQLRVTIAAFNRRAQTVWQRLGFTPIARFTKTNGQDLFTVMTCSSEGFVSPERGIKQS
ncbi:MAG: GNAT family N-acetyltransferase [Cyanobacteria bacterium J06648_16]